MMDFVINGNELAAMSGLPYIQQLAYIRGIRPYMDVKTGLVGAKRRISYQSLTETLYVEPHQGIQSGSPSRQQLRRVIKSLERAGVITVQSDKKHLILKCLLVASDYSVQNKADTNPTHKAGTNPTQITPVESTPVEVIHTKADIAFTAKADIPLINNNYLYILFGKFWEIYPQKKSKTAAWEIFQALNPDTLLCQKICNALIAQINHHALQQAQGLWVPSWKYPATWLAKRCWEDELPTDTLQENQHATHKQPTRKCETKTDLFCPPCDADEPERNNVIPFKQYQS